MRRQPSPYPATGVEARPKAPGPEGETGQERRPILKQTCFDWL